MAVHFNHNRSNDTISYLNIVTVMFSFFIVLFSF